MNRSRQARPVRVRSSWPIDPLRRAERQRHPAVLDFQKQVGAGEGQAQKTARIDRQDWGPPEGEQDDGASLRPG